MSRWMMRQRCMLAGAALLGLAAQPALASELVLQDGNWTLSCDTDGLCIADSFVSVGQDHYLRLALERPADPSADMVLEFQSSLTPPVGGKLRLWVPSEDYRMVGDITKEPSDGKVRFGGITPNEPMMMALKAAATATAVVELPNGKQTEIAVSLDGFTPIFALMDDAQGRIGRKDAVVVQGPRDPAAGRYFLSFRPGETQVVQSTVTDDRRVPITETRKLATLADIPDRVREAVAGGPACPLPDTIESIGGTFYGIDERSGIWELPCFLGAYQGTFVYVYSILLDGDLNAALLHFQGPPTGEPTEDPEIISPIFDPKTSLLTSFARARGVGDCGRFETYELVFLEGESIGWDALELREKKDCNGVDDAPESYPLIWKREG
ncbi:DUF1176 domain-containing protein [Pannonibacter sp. SL95]|uniref:DUF1176 domain-containing protein n=1 Tax=Pannonibacter sp. SL95 TaxID=2995153 RepID=UPI0022744DCD|nr:DUF1176 domain-containing protein [Pannonibacter sp. SL95]MCY1707439.1 DUF1176 domain-containing protein [Pannonibacter sp. SL95]